jgi:hypothetical protein
MSAEPTRFRCAPLSALRHGLPPECQIPPCESSTYRNTKRVKELEGAVMRAAGRVILAVLYIFKRLIPRRVKSQACVAHIKSVVT